MYCNFKFEPRIHQNSQFYHAIVRFSFVKTEKAWRSLWPTLGKSERLSLDVRWQYQPPSLQLQAARVINVPSRTALFQAFGSHQQPSAYLNERYSSKDHEGRQVFSVLVFLVTQRWSSYIKDSLWLSLILEPISFLLVVCKVLQAKNWLFLINPLSLRKPLKSTSLAKRCLERNFGLDMLRDADETLRLKTAMSSFAWISQS